MEGYFKWFLKEGWKRYAVPFMFSIVFTILYFKHLDEIFNAPIVLGALMSISKFGFDIAIVSHSIMAYRASK